MGQLKQLEQQILDEWRRFAESKHDAEEFSEDGLLWRGLIYYADGSWHRREGNEEELWLNAKRRLLILTKDLNDTEAWNIRQETGRQNTAVFSYQYGAPFIKTCVCGPTDYYIQLQKKYPILRQSVIWNYLVLF